MAGSSNFVIHNPTNANQEPTTDFANDSITTGGIGVDEIMPSRWMNARWYEDSVGFWALAQMMANKGFVMDKTSSASLVAALANIITTADGKLPLVLVNYSPTPTFPASTANGFDFTLNGNVTSSSFDAAPNISQILTFVIVQGATPFTFVPPSSINGWLPVNTVPNSITIQQFIVRIDGSIWPVSTELGILLSQFLTLQNVIGTITIPTVTLGGNSEYSLTGTSTIPISANGVVIGSPNGDFGNDILYSVWGIPGTTTIGVRVENTSTASRTVTGRVVTFKMI